MVIVFICLFVGIGLGAYRKTAFSRRIANHLSTPFIMLLLFVLGIRIGADKDILSNIGSIGATSAVITVCSMTGGIALSGLYYRLRKQPQERSL